MQYSGAGRTARSKKGHWQLPEKEAWYDRNALHNQSTLQIRKLEKSTLAILDLKTDNFEKFTVDGNYSLYQDAVWLQQLLLQMCMQLLMPHHPLVYANNTIN